jgi:hypothetical protein
MTDQGPNPAQNQPVDPSGQWRWDGTQWVPNVQPEQPAETAVLPPMQLPELPATPTPPTPWYSRRWFLPTLIGVVALLAGVGIGQAGNNPETKTVTQSVASISVSPSPVISVSPSPVVTTVTKMVTMTAAARPSAAAPPPPRPSALAPPPPRPSASAPPPTPRPPTSAAANCDPAYPDVCLHDGIGDYDCAGGSGNGPNYVSGPIRVLPPDPFGLDSNGDGIGCA